MKRLSRQRTMANFDNGLAPAVEIKPGEKLIVETNLSAMPATGPIAILGAEAGDTLVVTIHHIEVLEAHWWYFDSDNPFRRGAYQEINNHVGQYQRSVHPRLGPCIDLTIPVEDGFFVFSERLRVPLRPMIGCIGVAPAGEAQPTNLGGHYGGNMDCRDIEPGARVYFPVAAPGGLLGLCDVHGAQGDNEVFPTLDCIANVTLSADIRKGFVLPMIYVETEAYVHSIGYGTTIEEATNDAFAGMIQLLQNQLGLGYLEAAQLIGTSADVRICQLVNALINMRICLPKVAVPQLAL